MQRKNQFVTALGKNKRKGWVKSGFDAKTAGMLSKEDVVAYLDERQQEWQETNPGLIPTNVRDEINKIIHIGIGCTAWYGFRFFYPIPKSKVIATS